MVTSEERMTDKAAENILGLAEDEIKKHRHELLYMRKTMERYIAETVDIDVTVVAMMVYRLLDISHRYGLRKVAHKEG